MSEEDCLFCNLISTGSNRIIEENADAFAIEDAFPVTLSHSLVIPKRHVESYFALTTQELLSVHQLVVSRREAIASMSDEQIDFNVGINCGELAGQTIKHCHVHLFPRRRGDIPDPEGGVRNLIPGKGPYRKR